MKKFLEEFKAFALKGNVMDLAIGVIIGAAFGDIVTAFTEDFINPIIACIGGAEVAGRIRLGDTGQALNWGHFITAVINFLIMAFCIFLMMKAVNKVMSIGRKKEEEKPAAPPEPTKEEILLTEIRDLLKENK
ncbi:MAG: large conductance mechanosensitive channel protein MscL [Ruminococcus flavefaciens]|nr:large conductance mechanosensitive channel protein MscL [Ruminococcus flavefaciens]MCM1360495.1 large conductance mechanosensitive channel protein MscL [Clostridiales bacterium]MCM1435831.1 large conductance mechanosensitive channel protein MscL [Ruminococcus flavefaciens]